MDASKPAPIACTLTPNEFKSRAAWISQLTETSLVAHRLEGDTAHFLYRLDAKKEVEQLVRQEQACCAFLSFAMADTALGISVTITAPAEARSGAHALFAHLLPSHSVATEPRACGCGS
ncbi:MULTISPECIES: hypothetical protein [unclassified Pigmentiphaga]|uniref:hypothetical protein n=1 Tax=unclassified Pigmentiphaga TaxID=2626614 RepID=UPI00104D9788|nr:MULTISPECIES: hypothetical protein [unclassified Pigmentiphaga]